VFGGGGELRHIPPRARSSHLHDLLGVLDEVNARGASGDASLGPVLDRVAELTSRRRSLIAIASDMFDRAPEPLQVLRRLRARRHDVALFQTLDPHELRLPFSGLTIFESLESRQRMLVDPGAVRSRYHKELHRFLARVRRECVGGGVEHHLVSTGQPLEKTLVDFLTQRGRGQPVDQETARQETTWNS